MIHSNPQRAFNNLVLEAIDKLNDIALNLGASYESSNRVTALTHAARIINKERE